MSFVFPTGLTTDEQNEIAFLDGLTAEGGIATVSFWHFSDQSPHKWQNDGGTTASPGVGGGTVTYSFNDNDFTDLQKTYIENALTLWSDIANIKFVLAPEESSSVVFAGSATASAFEKDDGGGAGEGFGKTTMAYVSLNTSATGSYGDFTSFTTTKGFGIGTVVHELGHLLGLGHGGPYNGDVNSSTQQFSAYDNNLYTIMSYIDPSDKNAKYYSDYTTAAKDVNWNGAEISYTPQLLDILAIQQLYGASTSSTYAGGQIFGFNCNISDASKIYYDFTQDTAPIVTLFDYGLNNRLDLSGYSMACTVNLNQGAFSSVGGLVNNLSIAYGTSIDSAIGGGGDDIFYVNSDANDIDGRGGSNTVVFSGAFNAYSISYSSDSVLVTVTSTGVIDTLTNIQAAQFSDQTIALCFLAGTLIATPKGEIAVENLRPGDLVLTAQGEARPMVWLGRMTVATRFADPLRHFPIRIKAGALADNMPRRDLLLSPDHAILVENILVHAGALANGVSILRETALPETFTYYHVELDDHALILAEGAPAETFIDNADRMNFDNWAEHLALYPDGKPVAEMIYPRAKGQRQIPSRLRAALDRRAEALGLTAARAA